LASKAFHHDFASSFLIFTALVNIHHFILDGAIWKLRDGRIASLLLNSRDKISDAATDAGGSVAAAMRWLVGGTAGARRLRVGAVLLLLVWGTVDQARYYLALNTGDLQDLQRAAKLNGFDSSLQMRLARKETEDGELQQAEAAWRRAVQANPSDPAARQGLLRLLIDQNRYDEAYSLTESSLKYAPKDANLLVDRGLLAVQSGHGDQALASWNQALAVDPHQSLVHLYLADELDREGKAQAAASHYTSFLGTLARQASKDRPTPDRVIAIVLRLADCQTRSSQVGLAVQSYRLAEALAIQTGQPKLESLADVNEAELQAKTGRVDDALRLYQHALLLDQSNGDNSASAQDWSAYGRFLDDTGFPARLAYASLLKSENLTKAIPNSSVSEPQVAARRQLEKKLGTEAALIRRDPDPALREALAVRR
jgi:tetratricopeptide (TPR) repeat protein